ncbi:MAG: flagellar biosynthesis protein FlgF [Candidatus Melainabacteria bacterium HGW-Melainabacteria-1]|nr:MAG: flagellar biosynthesis protein FlgF [Candidatus Melainabacteria bacterium HGW-Melainabacteria-1]
MSRGFYAATAAMMSDVNRFETVANNLANINTHGFKRHQTLHHDFQEGFVKRVQSARLRLSLNAEGQLERERVQDVARPIGQIGTGTYVTSSWTHFDPGALQATESPLDLALQGEGFFTVAGPDGEIHFTRNGHFKLNAEGELVTHEGLNLLGRNGAIRLDPAAAFSVDADGQIVSEGEVVDQLVLVDFDRPQLLVNEGANRYIAIEGMEPRPSTAKVSQGFLEQANVDVASEMVQMISALRSYQISQKALQSEDEMTGKLIEVGRV